MWDQSGPQATILWAPKDSGFIREITTFAFDLEGARRSGLPSLLTSSSRQDLKHELLAENLEHQTQRDKRGRNTTLSRVGPSA